MKVFFITVYRLLTQLRESHSMKALRQMESRFEKYDFICDEFGYVSFDKQGADFLFNHLPTIPTREVRFEHPPIKIT